MGHGCYGGGGDYAAVEEEEGAEEGGDCAEAGVDFVKGGGGEGWEGFGMASGEKRCFVRDIVFVVNTILVGGAFCSWAMISIGSCSSHCAWLFVIAELWLYVPVRCRRRSHRCYTTVLWLPSDDDAATHTRGVVYISTTYRFPRIFISGTRFIMQASGVSEP